MSEGQQQDQLDVSDSSADDSTDEEANIDNNTTDSGTVDPTDNGWAGFRKGGNKFVTVRSSGSIAPNSAVVRDHFGGADAVQLFFKEGQDLIGIKPVETYDEDNDRLYKISEDGGSISINTHAFMKAWDIEHEETIRYRPEWDDEMQMLIVDISESGTVVETGTNGDDA